MSGLAAPLRALRSRSDHRPLSNSSTKVSSASTKLPAAPGACRTLARGETDAASETPLLDGRRTVPRSWPSSCPRSWRVSVPFVLLAQMRHGNFGQRIEGAAAVLAAKPQKPVRRPSRRSRGPRNADNLDARPARRQSFQARPRSACSLSSLKDWHRRRPSRRPRNGQQTAEKASDFIESFLDPTPV